MKRNLLLSAIIILSFSVFLSGCLVAETPTDKTIVINDQIQTYDVIARTDCNKAVWTINETSRTDTSGEKGKISYHLDYNDFQTGEYTLKVEDCDQQMEWKITVFHEKLNDSNNTYAGYGGYSSWEEMNRVANEKNKEKK